MIENRMVRQFEKQFELIKKKGWRKIYVGVDIHETILKPTWSTELSTEYYEYSKETLRLMNDDPQVCLILWSCSLPHLNESYYDFFVEAGIVFDYINENPECPSTEYANFDDKLYFNVGIDDKFGFDVERDWKELYLYFLKKRNDTIFSREERGPIEVQ
jgi:hypothetical protein